VGKTVQYKSRTAIPDGNSFNSHFNILYFIEIAEHNFKIFNYRNHNDNSVTPCKNSALLSLWSDNAIDRRNDIFAVENIKPNHKLRINLP
jgi:hypothetical protein